MSRFSKGFSIIPYADVTTDMVTASIFSSKDHMVRAVRGNDDHVIVIYNLSNASTFSDYKTHNYNQEYSEYLNSPEFSKRTPNSTVDFVEIKGDIKDATSSEIYDIVITTAGTGYSAGTLTATGGGGGSFKGTYAVNGSGAITGFRILTMGTGYTSMPTIVISDSGDGNAVLTPKLRGEGLEGNTRVLDISLKDDLTYASTLTVDKNSTATTTGTTRGLSIDYDHTGICASGQTINNTALDIDVNSDSPTMVGTVNNKGIDIMCMGGTSGTQTNLGLNIITRDADTNDGISIQCNGTHLKLIATADADDYASFRLQDTGDLTISTVGDGTTDSDLILDVDGSIEFNADNMTDGIVFKDASATVASITAHHNASWFLLNENGGASTDDYFAIECLANGATTLWTKDTAANDAHLKFNIDGHVEFEGSGVGFDLVTPTYNATTTSVIFATGNKQFVTFGSGNITNLSLTFPATSGNFTVLLKQDGSGSRTITNYKVYDSSGSLASGSASVKFAGGSNPTLTTDANHVDIISIFWDADNEIAYGVATLDFQF